MEEEKKPELKRPIDPKTGAVILFGSLAGVAAAVWLLSAFVPFSPETLAGLPFSLTSRGAWLILGTWVLFPVVFAGAFLVLAKGVDPSRLAFAYAGVTYFLQCWAELEARDTVSLWPELLLTALATIAFHSLAGKHPPKESGESEPSS